MSRIENTSPTMLTLEAGLAAEHVRDLRTAATRYRMIALARCCRPAARQLAAIRARAAMNRLADRFRRDQVSRASICPNC